MNRCGGKEGEGGGFQWVLAPPSQIFVSRALRDIKKKRQIAISSPHHPPTTEREDFEGGIVNKAGMLRKRVRGLELGLKSHSERNHGDNVIPAALWINPVMHSEPALTSYHAGAGAHLSYKQVLLH